MNRRTQTLLVDVAVGLAAGLVATKAYGLVQEAFYRSTPKNVRQEEERVRPAPSSELAAAKIAESLGYSLDKRQRKLAGNAVHYGLGAGILTGATLSLIVDEGLAPALGFSAPNQDYPALTHVRGFFNHLAYGAAVAVTAEAFYWFTNARPDLGERRGKVTETE
jgi:hypothetical protein